MGSRQQSLQRQYRCLPDAFDGSGSCGLPPSPSQCANRGSLSILDSQIQRFANVTIEARDLSIAPAIQRVRRVVLDLRFRFRLLIFSFHARDSITGGRTNTVQRVKYG